MTPPSMTAVDSAAMRSALGHFPTGVVVVTGRDGGEPVGMTLQSFVSLSLEPPLVLLSVARTSSTWPRIAPSRRFLINVLSEGQQGIARQFARSGTDKFAGVGLDEEDGLGGPRLEGCTAWVDCELESEFDGGDHIIVVARVLEVAVTSDEAPAPLVFHRSGFPRLLPETKGTATK